MCLTAAATDWVNDLPSEAILAGRIRPDAVICCPATFNTLNKWAAGINDSPALGVLNDAVGLGTPTLVVPMVAERLCRHPVWPTTRTFLKNAVVDILDPADGALSPQPREIRSGTGDRIAAEFQPRVLLEWLEDNALRPVE